MDPELEEFFVKFLAKNKYPLIKTKLSLNKEFQKITEPFEVLENKKSKSSNVKFALALNYFGLGTEVPVDLNKSLYWLKQLPSMYQCTLSVAILHILIYLRFNHSNYRRFISDYHTLIEKLPKMDLSSQSKLYYRFLKLLSGWVKDFHEYELSNDFNQLSEMIESDEEIDLLQLDQLMNRWLSQGKKLELHLIRGIIGHQSKLDHHLPINIKHK